MVLINKKEEEERLNEIESERIKNQIRIRRKEKKKKKNKKKDETRRYKEQGIFSNLALRLELGTD